MIKIVQIVVIVLHKVIRVSQMLNNSRIKGKYIY